MPYMLSGITISVNFCFQEKVFRKTSNLFRKTVGLLSLSILLLLDSSGYIGEMFLFCKEINVKSKFSFGYFSLELSFCEAIIEQAAVEKLFWEISKSSLEIITQTKPLKCIYEGDYF